MININQTSENSKIYIQRNITNDEPVINNYVTEDELQEILKEYNTVPYIVVDGFSHSGFEITKGDWGAVNNAIHNNEPYLIYARSSNTGTVFTLAENIIPYSPGGASMTTTLISAQKNVIFRIWEIDINGNVELYLEDKYTIQTKLVSGENIKTINGNDILGSGDIKIDVDLTGYATEQWVDDKGYLKEIPEEYVTETELNDALANVGNGNIVELTQEEYNNTTPEPDTLYVITDAPAVEIPDTSNFVDKETLTYEIDAINISLSQKQDTLVSGVNIKTINGNDLLGSGDIVIEGGSGNIVELTQSEYNAIIPDDDTLYLISDSNIYTSLKTINGESIIGEGDIKVEASVDLSGYATEQWVDDKGYAKLSYVDEQIGNINNVLENIIG